MKMTPKAQGFALSEAIDQAARRHFEQAMQHYEEHVVSTDIFMSDVNGPKGGIDKQVLVRIRLRAGRLVTVEATRADLYAAMANCAKRSKRAVGRTLRKSQRLEKRRLRKIRYAPDYELPVVA